MGKIQTSKNSKPPRLALAGLCIAVAAITLLVVSPKRNQSDPSQETTSIATGVTGEIQISVNSQPKSLEAHTMKETLSPDQIIAVPSVLQDGKLELTSLFQFTGINPDRELEDCTNIAGIQITNTSDEYLVKCEVSLRLADGSSYSFFITDLPTGKSTFAFSPDNLPITENPICTEINCTAEYSQTASAESEQIAVSIDGISITLKNLTGEDLENITLVCRNPYGEGCYFGGQVYQYTVDLLHAGESNTIEALECFLGSTEVVRILCGPEK